MARAKRKSSTRDPGQFIALPHVVLNSEAFLRLGHPAVRLLLDIALQLKPNAENNGRLVVTMSALKSRGWTSNDTLTRARRELETAGLIVETRMGMRPHRAAWYAVTWRSLGNTEGMDSPESFRRGAYLQGPKKIATPTPSPGVGRGTIAPSPGVEGG